MNFAVIYTYTDGDVAVYLFETEEDAVSFLRSSYEEELRIDIEESGLPSTGQISDDGKYARIETPLYNSNEIDAIEIRVGKIYR